MDFGWSWHIEWQSSYEFHGHHIDQVLEDVTTQFQRVMVARLTRFGKSLIIDGKVQSTVSDEYIYHETLVHPLLLSLDRPKNVLILGGGEGATLREALKHESVSRAVMVDIDQAVIDFARKHLAEWHMGSFDDPRTTLVIDDALKYVERTQEKFDAVILDLTDPIMGNSSYKLYTREFYEKLSRLVSTDGGIVTQATSPSFSLDTFSVIYNTLRSVFRKVSASITYVPSFDGLWGFVYASNRVTPNELSPTTVNTLIGQRIRGRLRYYDGETHSMLFSIPKNVRDKLSSESRISTESSPITVPA
ncbi:Polyamine aminopropyltransferase [Metallosphaera sp. J1]|uniref:spermine/spermidine synthase domain-containing protein n=1 Tax=Metallosphaera TaxID=41980 RepID=UPI001EDE63F7|nr:methyltransferase domain-containing protein [Metallosphaera javensis (ex Hofmann et al. 2022)]MCG3107907.1 Polyamine aminopropyltransferase [Metallosphaera javensis (ex Hofmann et al. 2022)]BCS91937.1 MAG: spermidine synthase [Metallosphaera javensis (ex Sakai et al. 2022)]